MFSPILDDAARLYGNKVIFGFNELAAKGAPNTLPPPDNVIEAGNYGAGVEWQLNGNGRAPGSGVQITSCGGRPDSEPASNACFNSIMHYATELVPRNSNNGQLEWVEFWPADAINPNPMF